MAERRRRRSSASTLGVHTSTSKGEAKCGRPSRPRKLTELKVEKCREEFWAGNNAALLDAVDFCARAGLPMPPWLAEAFCARYQQWLLLRAKTLDEAFQVERPKGARLDDRAGRERLRGSVILRVLLLSREGVPRLEAFRRVGAELGISNKLAEAIFYERESRSWRWFLSQFETLERAPE